MAVVAVVEPVKPQAEPLAVFLYTVVQVGPEQVAEQPQHQEHNQEAVEVVPRTEHLVPAVLAK